VNEDIIETLRRIQCSDAACGNLRIAMGIKLAIYEIEQLRNQRDEAWLKIGRIHNEIDCRIEHGADSNGHLEAIRNMIDMENDK
jgi:hypothetical protein